VDVGEEIGSSGEGEREKHRHASTNFITTGLAIRTLLHQR